VRNNAFASIPESLLSDTMFSNRAALDGVINASSNEFNECYIRSVGINAIVDGKT
jgi:hypothetical protein